MKPPSSIEKIAEGVRVLPEDEAFRLFARWNAHFVQPLHVGPRDFLPSVIEARASSRWPELGAFISDARGRDVYLFYEYDRHGPPVVFSAARIKEFPTLVDLAISDRRLTWTIICHHEDGMLSNGPFLLRRQELANLMPDRTPRRARRNIGRE